MWGGRMVAASTQWNCRHTSRPASPAGRPVTTPATVCCLTAPRNCPVVQSNIHIVPGYLVQQLGGAGGVVAGDHQLLLPHLERVPRQILQGGPAARAGAAPAAESSLPQLHPPHPSLPQPVGRAAAQCDLLTGGDGGGGGGQPCPALRHQHQARVAGVARQGEAGPDRNTRHLDSGAPSQAVVCPLLDILVKKILLRRSCFLISK